MASKTYGRGTHKGTQHFLKATTHALQLPPPIFADVTITTAQVLALFATPRSLVAAPGAGYWLLFRGIRIWLDYNSAAYAGIAAGEDLVVKYTNAAGAEASQQIETTGFLDLTADAFRWAGPSPAAIATVPVVNAALVLHLLVAEIITGNSPLKCRTYYNVMPTTW